MMRRHGFAILGFAILAGAASSFAGEQTDNARKCFFTDDLF